MATLRSRIRPLLALLAGLVVLSTGVVAAYATQRTDDDRASGPAPTSQTSEPGPTVPPTTAEPTTTTTEPPATAFQRGDTGIYVELLQQRLYDLGYFLPERSGTYDEGTAHAVMAFQKLHGLARDGVAGPQTLGALEAATPVAPTQGTDAHLEVSLDAQVLIVVDGQGRAVAIDATTGKASTPTPAGSYTIFRQVDGWDPGPYGSLYRPKYFVGGIAVHGGPPVIADPASHGCVRVPDPAIDWLWSSGLAPRGARVVVV